MEGEGVIRFERATKADAKFLARATVMAERAHTAVGMWDLLFGVQDVLACPQAMLAIQHVIESSAKAHVFYTNFFVARAIVAREPCDDDTHSQRDESTAVTPVGSACFYSADTASAQVSFEAVARRVELNEHDAPGWGTPEAAKAALDRVSFLNGGDGIWPDLPIYDRSVFVESVFVAASHRRRGIAAKLLNQCFAEARTANAPRVVILCEIGNNRARRLYEHRLGMRCVGQFLSETCKKTMGSPGFDLLLLDIDPNSASSLVPAQSKEHLASPDSDNKRTVVGVDHRQQQAQADAAAAAQRGQGHAPACRCGCVPQHVKSLFEMAALRAKHREAAEGKRVNSARTTACPEASI